MRQSCDQRLPFKTQYIECLIPVMHAQQTYKSSALLFQLHLCSCISQTSQLPYLTPWGHQSMNNTASPPLQWLPTENHVQFMRGEMKVEAIS